MILAWSDETQVLLHSKYNSMSMNLKDLRIRALRRPMPFVMTEKDVVGMYQEPMEDISLSEDEVDDWEEIDSSRYRRGARNGEPMVKEDGEVKQLVNRIREGFAVGAEFVGAMVNGDTSMVKGDTKMIE